MRFATATKVNRPAPWRRSVAGVILAVATACALPVALALACVPGAAIGFDRQVYEYRAGETVAVLGRAFAPSTQVTLTLQPPSGASTTVGHGVLTDSAGFFSDSFTLPGSAIPGAYVVVATVNTTDVDGHGRVYAAREVLSVIAPPAPPPRSIAVRYPVPAPAASMPLGGTDGDDTIVGTPFADMIKCGAGDDTVRSGAGNDVIDCGAGRDRINSGSGADRVKGGSGADQITGASGKDRLSGGSGKDRISGGSGNDKLLGGSGNDTLRGNAGRDGLRGGPGRDTLFRGRGDTLSGGSGKDRILG